MANRMSATTGDGFSFYLFCLHFFCFLLFLLVFHCLDFGIGTTFLYSTFINVTFIVFDDDDIRRSAKMYINFFAFLYVNALLFLLSSMNRLIIVISLVAA